MAEKSSPKSPSAIRARRWSAPSPSPVRPYRFALRIIGIPAVAVAGVLIYSGLRDHFVLPECDSERAKHTLSDILNQLKIAPVRYEPIKTVSSSKEQIVCSAVLPLPDGGNVAVDYSFYWEGNKANMKYSISRKPAQSSAISSPHAAAYRSRPPSASGC
jgi:hypothetical protein